MMFRSLALVVTLAVISCPLVAHNHHHLSKEELIQVVLKQERIIEKQKECNVCLEDELAHIKHKLHEKHRYHALKKALHDLFGI